MLASRLILRGCQFGTEHLVLLVFNSMKHYPAQSTFSSSEPSTYRNKLGFNSTGLADWVKFLKNTLMIVFVFVDLKGCH